MIRRILDNKNPFWQFLGRLFDVAVLNLLWTVCSIPILTIGASTTAVYAVCLKMIRERVSGTAREFFQAWRLNWKQSTVLSLLWIVGVLILAFDLWYFFTVQTYLADIPKYLICGFLSILLMIVMMTFIYAFALLAVFENTVKGTLQNAVILALRHPLRSLLMLVIDVLFLLGTILSLYYMPVISVLFLLFGVGFVLFVNSLLLTPIILKYMPQEDDEDISEEVESTAK